MKKKITYSFFLCSHLKMPYYFYIINTVNFTFNTKMLQLELEEKIKYIEFVKFYNFIDYFHPQALFLLQFQSFVSVSQNS